MSNCILTRQQLKVLIRFRAVYQTYEGPVRKIKFLEQFLRQQKIFISIRQAQRILSK